MPPKAALNHQPPAESPLETLSDVDDDASRVPGDGAHDELPLDAIFGLLSASRRRRVLDYLFDEEAATTLGDLARHLAAIENDKPVQAVTAAERKRVYIALYQCHLPKMDDVGVIDFDRDRGTIKRTAQADILRKYLLREEAPSRPRYNPQHAIALAFLGGGLLVAQHAVYPVAWLSGVVAGGLIALVALFAVQAGWRR